MYATCIQNKVLIMWAIFAVFMGCSNGTATNADTESEEETDSLKETDNPTDSDTQTEADAGAPDGTDAHPDLEAMLQAALERMPEMFRLNQQRQEEGYYMAEFEFKMLGLAYYLDHEQYEKALAGLETLYQQLKTAKGLIKVPDFKSDKETYAFYRSLQNPKTGAFMDDSYPFCTFQGPTENVLATLENLAEKLGEPLTLDYPITYLDEIKSIDAMTAMLDSLATVGPIVATFPQTPYALAREFMDLHDDGNIFVRNKLYTFDDAWQDALLKWFYENQDEQTGLWGPKSRETGALVSLDINNTASIVKWLVDRDGNDLYADYPLRYKDALFESTLAAMSDPLPEDDAFEMWHEWNLKMGKGMDMLIRYLWKDASAENKSSARELFEQLVVTRFDKFYVPKEGAFSYYPGTGQATLDGTGAGLNDLLEAGALSTEKQNALFDEPLAHCTNLGTLSVAPLKEEDFQPFDECEGVSSIRFYSKETVTDVLRDVVAVYYPEPPRVLDVFDAVPKIKAWLADTDQTMGNWISKAELEARLDATPIDAAPIFDALPLDALNAVLDSEQGMAAVGFDVLQIPRCVLSLTSNVL